VCLRTGAPGLENRWRRRVKTTASERTANFLPCSVPGISFLRGTCGHRATERRLTIEEADSGLKRCSPFRGRVDGERMGNSPSMRQAVESGDACVCARENARDKARVCAAKAGAQSAPQFARDSRERYRLLPPSDGFRVVVASVARAVCADRATVPGPPRRSTRVQPPIRLTRSFVSHSQATHRRETSTNRSCRERATFKAPAGRHYSDARILSLSRKKWHTR
jgi:hypothetical protein